MVLQFSIMLMNQRCDFNIDIYLKRSAAGVRNE